MPFKNLGYLRRIATLIKKIIKVDQGSLISNLVNLKNQFHQCSYPTKIENGISCRFGHNIEFTVLALHFNRM